MKYSLANDENGTKEDNTRKIHRAGHRSSFRFHYNETRRKKYFKNIAYKKKKKETKKRKERKRRSDTGKRGDLVVTRRCIIG